MPCRTSPVNGAGQGTRSRPGAGAAPGDVPKVVLDVMEEVAGERVDGEVGAIAADAGPQPPVVADAVAGRGPRSPSCATPAPAATTTYARSPRGRSPRPRCAASSAGSATRSTAAWSLTRRRSWGAREGTWGRLETPARPAQPLPPALRTSHFPDPPAQSLRAHHPTHDPPLDRHRGTPGSLEAGLSRERVLLGDRFTVLVEVLVLGRCEVVQG